MKVMHIITRMIVGGAQENTLFNCMDLIRDYGDQVILVTGPSLGAEGKLLSQTDTTGLEIEYQPSLIRAIQPVADTKALLAIKRSIQTWKPDVVHTHSAKAGMIGREAAWKSNVPCVIHTVHGAPFHPYQNFASRWFYIQCERWAAKRCHHMISVANAMTELMVSAQVAPANKFTTIYSGMDVDPFLSSDATRHEMRHQLGFRDTDVVVGKIARLFHLKGHEYVIQAAKEVCAAQPDVKFLFVGDGILRAQMERDIAQLGLSDRFVFAGLVPPDQVAKYVGAMDILVHASLREGLARALPQALIAGKPAISFDVDGAKEVVINDETGCLIPPKDTQALAQAMTMLARNRELRMQLGRNGQMRFTQQFQHRNMTTQIRQLYSRFTPKA
jgi:glycosyltransferase involved in cell wall biosynthesis